MKKPTSSNDERISMELHKTSLEVEFERIVSPWIEIPSTFSLEEEENGWWVVDLESLGRLMV